jgi:sortase (surface protein transpeptidase)
VRARRWAAVTCAGLAVVAAGTGGLLLTRHGTPGLRPVAPVTAPASASAAAAAGRAPSAAATAAMDPSAVAAAFPTPTAPIVAATQSAPPGPVASPVSLAIPRIGVSTRLITLGVTASGEIQVPPVTTVAGWYTRGPRPGATGPAIILGHVDSTQGPGVFYRLVELRPGDRIDVRRSDGTTVTFAVTTVQSYAKDHFPTQDVYGPTPDAELRLITCGGAFDSATGHYLSNIVVYATEAG